MCNCTLCNKEIDKSSPHIECVGSWIICPSCWFLILTLSSNDGITINAVDELCNYLDRKFPVWEK